MLWFALMLVSSKSISPFERTRDGTVSFSHALHLGARVVGSHCEVVSPSFPFHSQVGQAFADHDTDGHGRRIY